MIAVTNEEMKKLEKFSDENGVSYTSLMINAGTNAAKKIIDFKREKIIKNKKILFLAGKGNNGGDCFVSARYLASEGFKVTVLMMAGEPKTELAKSMFNLMSCVKSDKIKIFYVEKETPEALIDIIDENSTIVDGVFGTGFHGKLPKDVKDVFEYINCVTSEKHDVVKIAYDIPSGGNGTIGSVAEHTFKADYTFAFGALKTGLVQYPLKSFCGEIEVINIGFTKKLFKEVTPCLVLDDETASLGLTLGKKDSNKGDFGNLLAITGSKTMPGACAMSSLAALRSGVGLLTVATVGQNIPILATKMNEAMYVVLDSDENGFILFNQANKNIISQRMEKASAMLVGCGIGVTEDTKELTKWIIESATCPVVIDADGLNCIAGNTEILKKASSKIVITPHPKEFSRLTGKSVEEIQSNRLQSALDFSIEYPNVTLVLKGAGTIIAKNGEIAINLTGNQGLAKGGSGDVLAGIISALIARQKCADKKNIFEAVASAVYIHGKAGDIAMTKKSIHSMLPTDIIDILCDVFNRLEVLL